MSLHRLKWLAVVLPVLFLGVLDFLRHVVFPGFLHSTEGYLLLGAFLLGATLVFGQMIFVIFDRMQARLSQQNQELLALHQAGLAITGDLGLESVLQKVVDQARELVGARYGALSLLNDDGNIGEFLISGLSPEERAEIGTLPTGKGLLSVVLREGQRLCLADMTKDPRFLGFPPNHPPMRSLLAVPIVSYRGILGNLYVTEKRHAPMFSQEDQETLARFATQAALAIENARLHRRVKALAIAEERERIAHEMHDSLAQLLGYVNTKAQAAQELLRREQAGAALVQIGQLAQAARSAYADVRESILGLRTSLDEEGGLVEALRVYLPQWQDQSGVAAELVAPTFNGGHHTLPAAAELQLLRIIQEALANVRKHAHATAASVTVRDLEGGVEVVVKDNGQGFDPRDLGRGQFPRFGLATMRERAEAVGGKLDIDSKPGHGTQVIARVPTLGAVVLLRGGNGGPSLASLEP